MRYCLVDGCDKTVRCRGYCQRHYKQILHYGTILKRIRNDPNEFIVDGDVCWIILYDIDCEEVARTKIDTKYYEQIRDSKLKWHLNLDWGYAEAIWYEHGVQQHISLHQAIVQLSGREVPDGKEIDHKDRVKLNNLEDNLRVCDHSKNSANKEVNNKTGYRGVFQCNKTGKFGSQIRVNRKLIRLGEAFITKEDAARAYNVAAIKYHGEFAVLNDV